LQQSFLVWMLTTPAPYAPFMALISTLCFALTVWFVCRKQQSTENLAILLIAPIPLLIGIFAGIHGAMLTLQMASAAGETVVWSQDLKEGILLMVSGPLVGLLFIIPSVLAIAGSNVLRLFLDLNSELVEDSASVILKRKDVHVE